MNGGTLFAGYLCLLGMVYGVITIFTRDRKGGADLTPMPCGDVINHCVTFVRECERDFDLRNAGLHYRFVVSGRAAREFRSHFIVTSTDIMGRTIFDGSTTLMGHPCEIRMDASEPITLVFIPKGGVA